MKHAISLAAQILENTGCHRPFGGTLAFVKCSNLKCNKSQLPLRTEGRFFLDERHKDVKTAARCALCLINSVLAISIRARVHPR